MSRPDPAAVPSGAPDPRARATRAVSPPTPEAPGLGPVSVRVAEAVLAHPAVDSLSGGPFGAIATYLPGRRQPGVSLGEGDEPSRIAVVLRYGARVDTTARELRRIVAAESGARRVDVLVTDIVLPDTVLPDAP